MKYSTYRGWFARTTVFPTTIAAESVFKPANQLGGAPEGVWQPTKPACIMH